MTLFSTWNLPSDNGDDIAIMMSEKAFSELRMDLHRAVVSKYLVIKKKFLQKRDKGCYFIEKFINFVY